MDVDLAWQPSLLDAPGIEVDGALPDLHWHGLHRHDLADGAWVDRAPGWCSGADALFADLLARTPWNPPRKVRMYDRVVAEPRLTHRWDVAAAPDPLRAMASRLGERYGVEFTQVGANLYRDGADSVAWHGDRVARELPSAVVALVSLGAVRPFRLRPAPGRPTPGGPAGGARSIGFRPGPGDLLVMGGSCQRTWQHAVPKCTGVGPRISIQFRHAYQ